MPVDAEARFCPSCGSPLVEYSNLVGGGASCGACDWKGDTNQLLVSPFQHEFGSDEGAVSAFATDFRNTLARSAAADLGRLLVRWGFVSATSVEGQKQQLTRLLTAMAKGAVRAVIEERAEIVKETK